MAAQTSVLLDGQRHEAYHNPIIPGFAPDPSVVLVDDTFFLVTSSFHIFPGIPVYASEDLKEWVHIGNAFNRLEQIDLSHVKTKKLAIPGGGHMIAIGGLFAPTIRYHDGTFYIVCTNVGEEGQGFDAENFYITTTDIWKGEWSNPKPLDLHGIDPSLFVDEDGRAYIQGSWRVDSSKEQLVSTIKQYEIDLATGQRISDICELWAGHAQIYTEAPHIYKKDGYYYLLVAEGGTFEHHMLTIARATNIWGPYESCPSNPILTADGKPEKFVQDTGHGELFQDAEGLWWATVLGVRKGGSGYPMGRESFLISMEWPKDEWPHLHHPGIHFERNIRASKADRVSVPPNPRVADCYIRNPALEDYRWSDSGVDLRPSLTDLGVATGTTTFVGRRQREFECIASAILIVPQARSGTAVSAGLAVYKDDLRFAAIVVNFAESTVTLRLRETGETVSSQDVVVATVRAELQPATSIYLTIQASPTSYKFAFHNNDVAELKTLGEVDTAAMSARDFTGTLFGVFASTGNPDGEGAEWMTFRDFIVSAVDTEAHA